MKTLTLILAVCATSLAFAQDLLTLSSAERLAKSTNPILQAAAKDLAAMRAAKGASLAPYRPMLELSAFGMGAEGRPGMTPMDRPDMALRFGEPVAGLGAMLEWKFFNSGKGRTASTMADRMIAMAQSRADAAWLDLLHEVRVEFSEGLLAQETLYGLSAALEAATEVERITQAKFEAGALPEAYVLGARADRLRVEGELAEAKADLEGAIARIVVCCGAEVAGGRLGAWDVPLEAPASLEAAIEMGYKNSPRIAELVAEAERWRLRARFAKQTGLPDLSLVAGSDSMATRRGNMAGGSAVGLWLSWPIGDGGMRRSEIAEAERMAEQMDAMAAVERNNIRAALSTHWPKWVASPKVVAAAEGRASSAEEAFRVARLRFDAGRAIRAEVSTALADLEQARIGLAKANAYRRVAWTNLMRSLGQTGP